MPERERKECHQGGIVVEDDALYESVFKDPSLAAYRDEYADYVSNWKQLETKAGAAVVMAGAFLAAAISVVTRPSVSPDRLQVSLLILAIASLIGAIASAVQALRINSLELPPDGSYVALLCATMRRCESIPEPERATVMLRLLRRRWCTAAVGLHSANDTKAEAVRAAHSAALLGGVILGILAIWTVGSAWASAA